VSEYACHCCGRADRLRTRDHKLPRRYGGARKASNIVRCCAMCNRIKDTREYKVFVILFKQFLEEHGDEYRAANPDDGKATPKMRRKFERWLEKLRGTQRDG